MKRPVTIGSTSAGPSRSGFRNQKNWRYEALLLIHELTEMFLCMDRGMSFKAIDRFDMTFKATGEPGDDPKAPYHREHRFATRIERLLARELRVNWAKYEAGL